MWRIPACHNDEDDVDDDGGGGDDDGDGGDDDGDGGDGHLSEKERGQIECFAREPSQRSENPLSSILRRKIFK